MIARLPVTVSSGANVVLHVGLCKEIFARKHTATHKPTSAQPPPPPPPIVTTMTHTHTPINRLWSPSAYGLGGNKKYSFFTPCCQDFFKSNGDCHPTGYAGAAISVASYGRCARLFKTIHILNGQDGVNVASRLRCLPYPASSWALKAKGWCLNKTSERYLNRQSRKISNMSLVDAVHEQTTLNVCHNVCQRLATVNTPDIYRKYIATRPAWIFFRNTTTACYKYIGRRYIYFPTNCSRANIYETTLKLAKT